VTCNSLGCPKIFLTALEKYLACDPYVYRDADKVLYGKKAGIMRILLPELRKKSESVASASRQLRTLDNAGKIFEQSDFFFIMIEHRSDNVWTLQICLEIFRYCAYARHV